MAAAPVRPAVVAPPVPPPPPAPARPSIPALESVRPLPQRAPRAAEGGPPPAPADFDQPGMWEKVVALVLQRKRMLGHFLETARPLGWQDQVLVLEVDPAHRGLIEHRDNRAPLLAAMSEVYGRTLDYRCVESAAGAKPPSPPAVAPPPARASTPAPSPAPIEEAPPPSEPPPGFVDEASGFDASATAPPAEAASRTPAAAPAKRKHPGELSPEARDTMLWLEGDIVGP
jgi:hypothetical protein